MQTQHLHKTGNACAEREHFRQNNVLSILNFQFGHIICVLLFLFRQNVLFLCDELYRQVLESYLEQGQDYKEQLPVYFEAGNWKDYAIVAHAIKSSSLSIGAVTLSDLAKEQEFLGKDANAEEISRTYEGFYQEFCETLVEIKEMLTE